MPKIPSTEGLPDAAAAEIEALKAKRAEAAKHLLRLKRAETSYEGFIQLLHPDWVLEDFMLKLIRALDHLEKGTLTRAFIDDRAPTRGERPVDNLLITMPPRHGKTTFGSVHFPPYFLARNPRRYVMSCSYNAQLAADFGRQARDLADEKLVQQAFPDFRLANDSRAADVWRTESGGAYFGVGLGGTTSGRPANLLIIDDPLKSREDAESATMRNKVWSYYTSALSIRLQPEDGGGRPKQIVILTRWHPDDLAGRLQQTEDWREGRWAHLDMPAIIREEETNNVSVRDLPPDDPRHTTLPLNYIQEKKRYVPVTEVRERALWPSRFPLEDLKRKERLNPREFASLYMQKPYIEGGNLIRASWWRYYPSDLKPENFSCLIIAADTAFKARESSDYSVLLVAGLSHDGDIYVVDIHRGRWEFPDLKQRLIQLNSRWRGRGLRAIYIEDKASGQSLIQELRRESGLSVIPYKVTFDKVARVNAVTPLIEGGRVHLPEEAPWLDDFMSETQTFPGSTHDDQVDALSMALDVLSRQTVGIEALSAELDPSGSLNQTHSRDDHPALLKSLRNHFRTARFKGWGI